MQKLTGGPLGPMIDRPGSPGAPYGQRERQKKTLLKGIMERGFLILSQ